MFWKTISTSFTISAIALTATSLPATESYSQNANASDMTFVCSSQNGVPTMFAYTPGKVNLTPLMTWHPEYLVSNQSASQICQQVATKLQTQFQQNQQKYFAIQKAETSTLVCLVAKENDNCNAKNSEELFSINPNYDPTCILDNRQPLECVAIGRTRGVFSMPDSSYEPTWWPW
ncbi:hypothetical protein STA3757_03110 [Stanieria sp. NIES-3757]|nr:hypothetical protein STA3757_03110 [Stanieria sp. NIES-3757]